MSRGLIIDQGQTKRVLNTPFAICTGISDLEWFIEQLQDIATVWRHRGVSYGWATVSEPIEQMPNTTPKAWDD